MTNYFDFDEENIDLEDLNSEAGGMILGSYTDNADEDDEDLDESEDGDEDDEEDEDLEDEDSESSLW
jgi:hypothetical protein